MYHALLNVFSAVSVDFMLSEGIYVKAKSKENNDKVALWLGASTIVELTFKEAEKLLT